MPFILALIILFAIFLFFTVKVVTTGYVYVVERLGKYDRTLGPGLHIIIPIIDVVRARVSLKQQVIEIEPQSVITKDNVKVLIDNIVFFRVTAPKDAVYNIENYRAGVIYSSAINMRDCVGSLSLDQVLSERAQLNATILSSVGEVAKKYGIEILSVEIKNIEPPSEVLAAMEKQLKADREKRAIILEAEGMRQSSIAKAEGEKQAKILQAEAEKEANIRHAEGLKESQVLEAEGKARAIEAVAEANAKAIELVNKSIIDSGTNSTIIALKQVEALIELSKNPANKIILPTDSVSGLGSIAAVAEMLKK